MKNNEAGSFETLDIWLYILEDCNIYETEIYVSEITMKMYFSKTSQNQPCLAWYWKTTNAHS
jgi:hypothetical protein